MVGVLDIGMDKVFKIGGVVVVIVVAVGLKRVPNMFSREGGRIAWEMMKHLCMTWRMWYDVMLSIYHRLTITAREQRLKLVNRNVIVFVHGRNGKVTDFIRTVENIVALSDGGVVDGEWDIGSDEIDSFQNKVVRLGGEDYALRIVNLGATGNTSIAQDSAALRKAIKKFEDCNITLVGMSKGGLVCVDYSSRFADRRIKKIITISSPMRGTKSALFFPDGSVVHENLGFGTETINAIMNNKPNLPIYHIVPTWDHLIIPLWSAKYEDTPEDRIFEYKSNVCGHGNIQTNIQVAEHIIKWVLGN